MKVLIKAIAVDAYGNEQEITLESTPFNLRRIGRKVQGETEFGTFDFTEQPAFAAFKVKEEAIIKKKP